MLKALLPLAALFAAAAGAGVTCDVLVSRHESAVEDASDARVDITLSEAATAAGAGSAAVADAAPRGTLAECLACQYLFNSVFRLHTDRSRACAAEGVSPEDRRMCEGFLRDYGAKLGAVEAAPGATVGDAGPKVCYTLGVCNHNGGEGAVIRRRTSSVIVRRTPKGGALPSAKAAAEAASAAAATTGKQVDLKRLLTAVRGQRGGEGTPGTKGPRGDMGDVGDQGPAGNRGTDGEQGDVGPRGPPGGMGCPMGLNGKQCSGRGKCMRGVCRCVGAWSGASCHTVKKWATCTAVGDPHWRTFDSRTFNEYTRNIELLEYSDPTAEVPEAVTAYQCGNGRVAWNCKVGVRRGADAIRIHSDRSVFVNCIPVPHASLPKTTASGLKIALVGGAPTVTSVSGLSVRFHGSSLMIRAHAPQTGILRGMCGDFDGNGADDAGASAMRARAQPAWKWVARWVVPSERSVLECKMGTAQTLIEVKSGAHGATDSAVDALRAAGFIDDNDDDDNNNAAAGSQERGSRLDSPLAVIERRSPVLNRVAMQLARAEIMRTSDARRADDSGTLTLVNEAAAQGAAAVMAAAARSLADVDDVDGRPVLAAPDANAGQADRARVATDRVTGCTGPALDKASALCLFLWGKPQFMPCVEDVCNTGQSDWIKIDGQGEKEQEGFLRQAKELNKEEAVGVNPLLAA